jgi:hypothetical protein
MQNRLYISFVLVVVLALPLVTPRNAQAIPSFTRQYKTECTTCHTIYPELNEFGDAFLKNSYVMPSQKKAEAGAKSGGKGQTQPQQSGKSEAFWLSGIPEVLPVALTASFDLKYEKAAINNDKTDFSTRSINLLSGGTFRDKAGFFATYALYSQGTYDPNDRFSPNTPANNGNRLGELFVSWRNALGTPINLKVGRLVPKLTLWKPKNDIITTPVAAPLAYKVGISQFTTGSTVDALEANAILGNRVFIAGGVVDRDGQNEKEGYGHLSVKIGGTDLLGREPEVDFDRDSIWDYLSVTIGSYGYFGRNASLIGEVADKSNNFYRAGADLDILYKQVRVKASGVLGKDNNPGFLATAASLRSKTLAAEAEFYATSNVIGAFRYEYEDSGTGIVRRLIPAIAYAPLENTKLVLSYKHEKTPVDTSRIALLGLTISF